MLVREPIPGTVKKHLVPVFGATGAADLYRAFVEDACDRLSPEVPLALASNFALPEGWVAALARQHRLPVIAQGDGDLGVRLRRLATTALDSVPRVVLLGSDAPTLPVAHVTAALHALARARVVVGPSLGGGCNLLGVRAPLPDLFTRMPWRSERVLARTLARLGQARVTPVVLPVWYDVDTAADVAMLGRHLTTLATLGETPCPRTRRVLARLQRRSRASGRPTPRRSMTAP
jgi:rSAM/selenodomain-associated transferase 1